MTDKVQIEIPKADDKEVVKFSRGTLGYIKSKFKEHSFLIYSIVIIMLLTLISIIISITGLFLDQMRYNNAAYRYYTEKIQTLDELKAQEQKLLYQIKQDQQIIIKQNNALIKSKA